MDYRNLSLEEQVAQLFMVGYDGAEPNPVTRRFLERGVGGLIFFRDNFDALQPQTTEAIADRLGSLAEMVPAHLPRPLFGIDQEGGQVERLPHTLFPTALTPKAVALAKEPEKLARQMYAALAQNLVKLGFNLNFFPTLDVNFSRTNPIIGVRSFGDNAATVWRFGQIALGAFEQAGLIAVGKHFPGHGNGTVDSHLDLPTLHFTEEELTPFQQAIDAGLPAMLVAHGYYPALQTTDFEKSVPSSASPAVIQGLLRKRCGFNGVIITDDMCMGAITKHCTPVEAGLASLKAGVDILLYKQSTEDEWAVYQAAVQAFKEGELPLEQLYASLSRIHRLKARYLPEQAIAPSVAGFTTQQCAQQADAIARQGINTLFGDEAILPLPPNQRVLLVHPDRSSMGNYAFDVSTSEDLDALFRQAGFTSLESLTFPPRQHFQPEAILENIRQSPQIILMVSFNPLIYTSQAALYAQLRERFPNAPVILASAGTPYDRDALPHPNLHLSLCSYRPATMRALAQVMATGLASEARPLPVAEPKPL